MDICLILNEKNIINGYGIGENSLKNGINIKTDVDLKELCGNYKYENNKLVELTEEEKAKIFQLDEEVMEATEEQKLLSSVLLENAEIKEQLKQQQELIAAILLQNAELKGGNTNV